MPTDPTEHSDGAEGAEESAETPPDEAGYEPDGLDLARSAMRSAAGSTPATDPRARRSGGARSPFGPDGAKRRNRRIRPGEAQMSGAHPDGRDPQGVGSELDRLIGDRGWALDLQVRGVFARWTEIVGPEIGAHSTPETLLDGVLVVRTESTAWATQLKLLAADVVRRLNDELGDGTVTVVEVRGPNAPSWKHGRRSARGSRGPRDTYG
ncbi:DUF721 domain-containing protein [Nocardioides sambongensis]|uniref:DUF721 domain-containing protein n=1 Tax=Nocardioides sambongensis TaxID=2589074 RepID=UPI001E4A4A4A|nr:DciA family protein [Nocardioides sambongensis]